MCEVEITKYAENNLVYVNFGNPAESRKCSEEKRRQEEEERALLSEHHLESLRELQHQICDRLSVISAMVQNMEMENRRPQNREALFRQENSLWARTGKICENSRQILELMGQVMDLQEKGQAYLQDRFALR